MKLAIIGTRNPKLSYSDWEKLLLEKININNVKLIVSGGAKGIDTYAKLFAGRHGKPLMEFLPKYELYGRTAPLVRNRQIMQEANFVIAFPSDCSRGTYHAIKEAEKLGRKVTVIKIDC